MFVPRALSAVDCSKASPWALACYKWVQGTECGVDQSYGIDRLSDVPGFGRLRHKGLSVAAPALLHALIHQSAWKGNASNFAVTEF